MKIQIDKKYKELVICLAILIVSRVALKFYEFNIQIKNSNQNTKMQVTVIRNEKITNDKISYLVKYKNHKMLLNIYQNKYGESKVDISQFASYKYGDIIELNGKVVIPEKLNNPYEFDYKLYLNSNDIAGTIQTYGAAKIGERVDNFFVKYIYMYKESVSNKIDTCLPETERELFKSMVYGDDRNLDSEIKEEFSKNGISHLLAVSGLNVANLLVIANMAFKDKGSKIQKAIKIILLVSFCIMCNESLSIMRATVMSMVLIVFEKKNISIQKRIVLALFVILFINPYSLFNIGFILSFTATWGIVTFQHEIFTYLDMKLKKIFKLPYIKFKQMKRYKIYIIFKSIVQLLALNIAVTIAILPVQLYFFNTYEITSILSNLVIVPIASFSSIISFITVIFIHIPFVSDILINANYIFLKLIIFLCNTFTKLNLPTINVASPNVFSIILYYLVIVISRIKKYDILFFHRKNLKLVRIIANIYIYLSIVIVLSLYVYTTYFENYVLYFNVGQGNMTFIRYNRKNIVVDMGSTKANIANNTLLNYMNKMQYDKIDLAIITHMHEDHINGFEEIAKNIAIKKVAYLIPKVEDTAEYIKFEQIINEAQISTFVCQKNDIIQLKNIKIHILSPPVNNIVNAQDKINANSMVTLICTKNNNLLFMGDATVETENTIESELLKDKIDVLQVGHHGSKTSTSESFISRINVQKAVISSKKQVYGHPNNEVLSLLQKYHIKYYITEKSGAIKIKIK